MSWWTKKSAPAVEADAQTDGQPTARHVAVGYADTARGARQLDDAVRAVCSRLGLSVRTVRDESQLVDAAQDMTSAQVVVFPHFDALTSSVADPADPHWQGVRLAPASATAAGVTYVVGTTGQDGETLQTLQSIFGADVQSMSLLTGSLTEISRLEVLLEETLTA